MLEIFRLTCPPFSAQVAGATVQILKKPTGAFGALLRGAAAKRKLGTDKKVNILPLTLLPLQQSRQRSHNPEHGNGSFTRVVCLVVEFLSTLILKGIKISITHTKWKVHEWKCSCPSLSVIFIFPTEEFFFLRLGFCYKFFLNCPHYLTCSFLTFGNSTTTHLYQGTQFGCLNMLNLSSHLDASNCLLSLFKTPFILFLTSG